jgi:hypothetical protein
MRERSGWALGARAEEELFRVAEVFSEGRATGDVFYGSTLISIDLSRALAGMDLAGDAALLARVVDAIAGSVRVRIRAMRLAEDDLSRRFPDRTVGTARTETRFRTERTTLLVDVDLEASVGAASGASGA